MDCQLPSLHLLTTFWSAQNSSQRLTRQQHQHLPVGGPAFLCVCAFRGLLLHVLNASACLTIQSLRNYQQLPEGEFCEVG